MPTPSRKHVNWAPCAFTPTGGSATTYTGVTTAGIDPNGSLLKFDGDGDRYTTTIINDFNDPVITITCTDIGAMRAWPVGTVGTLVLTHLDARNVATAGGGALLYTLVNAIVADFPFTGAHRQYATGTITFNTFSSDGITNPLSVTAL
jgi:hypothetical protein